MVYISNHNAEENMTQTYAYSKSAAQKYNARAEGATSDLILSVAHHLKGAVRDGEYGRLAASPLDGLVAMCAALEHAGYVIKDQEAELYLHRRPRSFRARLRVLFGR